MSDPAQPATLDAPGTVCAFASHSCSRLAAGAGGFDQHHRWPVELGGSPKQQLLALCPLHHRRQHALVRYLAERALAAAPLEVAVTRKFTKAERDTATYAVAQWTVIGRPAINGWPCPAARA